MKKEMLANGEIVTELIKDFLINKTENNLKTLMMCLRDAEVFVSVEMELSEADKKRFMEAKEGEKIQPKDKVKIKPGLIKTKDGKIYFPVFTKEDRIPESRKKRALSMRIPFVESIKMALGTDNIEAMLVNAFTENFVLNKENLEIILNMPSSAE